MKKIILILMVFFALSSHQKCKSQDFIDFVFNQSANFGALYNWYAASDANLAPAGWHVPTLTELLTLQTSAGGYYAGGQEILAPQGGWGTNETGFSAMCGGVRNSSGSFLHGYQVFYMWTNTEYDSSQAWGIDNLNYMQDYFPVDRYNNKVNGYSVHLIKDDSTNPGTLTDYDGNVYNCVTIGSQVWTTSNWKCTHLNDGTAIPNVTVDADWAALTTLGMCYYNNEPLKYK